MPLCAIGPNPAATPAWPATRSRNSAHNGSPGLLAHARGTTALCTPTINGFGRFQPNALAPQSVIWGQDNRGAMLRVVGGAGDPATRIENRIGEPAANPYLYIASQIHAGLDGIRRGLQPPPACASPYAEGLERIPATLGDALDALQADAALTASLGPDFVRYFCQIKRNEIQPPRRSQRPSGVRTPRVLRPHLRPRPQPALSFDPNASLEPPSPT